MHFFNFGSSKEPDDDEAQPENDIMSLNSDVACETEPKTGKIVRESCTNKQLEVNS